jgi:phenylalanyl-tRNA synthetase alpha chain
MSTSTSLTTYLDLDSLRAALAVRDLTDPAHGEHAVQAIIAALGGALAAAWPVALRVVRGSPVVTARDNYDRLYYPADGVARDARYTRWIGPGVLLRTQTSAVIPPALDALARDPSWRDALIVCPGLVYRRDCIDRHHVGEPHQIDLWRIRRGDGAGCALGDDDLRAMIAHVAAAALPGWRWRAVAASHPYTERGLQIDAALPDGDGEWLEIGECGLASPRVLADAGLAGASGLAMGLGLDRLLMLRKGVPDIRLLRARDARVADQMRDLAPYRAVSAMPPARRDLSIAVDAGDEAEDLGDRVRAALGDRAAAVESVAVISETPHDALPAAARARIGLGPGQKNLLVRVVLRDLDRTLTADEANQLRDRIYAALHRGAAHQWATTAIRSWRRCRSGS